MTVWKEIDVFLRLYRSRRILGIIFAAEGKSRTLSQWYLLPLIFSEPVRKFREVSVARNIPSSVRGAVSSVQIPGA